MSWIELSKRVWRESQNDNIFDEAAQLAYYFLLAIFPFLLFLTTLLGLLAKTGSQVYENLLSYARELLPYAAFTLVVDTLKQVQSGAGGGKLSLGILATIWAASNGMSAIMTGLNRAYEVKENRPWWKTKAIAVAMTLSLSVFIIVSFLLVLFGTRIAEFISGYFGLETYFTATWNLLQWPVALLFVLAAFYLLYRYAPSRRRGREHVVMPGAVAGLVLWLLVSLAFRLYLQFFNSYNATYGSLGAVIVLLLWLYLSSAAILFGAEINAEIEQTSGAGTA